MTRRAGLLFATVVVLQLAYLAAMAGAGWINETRDASRGVPVPLDAAYAAFSDDPFRGRSLVIDYDLPETLEPVPDWARGLPRHAQRRLLVEDDGSGWTVIGPAGADGPWEPGRLALPAEVTRPPSRDPFREEIEISWLLPRTLPLRYSPEAGRWRSWDDHLQARLRRGALSMPQVTRVERTARPLRRITGAFRGEGDTIALFDAEVIEELAGPSSPAGSLEIVGLDGVRRDRRDTPEDLIVTVRGPGDGPFIALKRNDAVGAVANRPHDLIRMDAEGSIVGSAVPLSLARVMGRDPVGGGFLVMRVGETSGRMLARLLPDGRLEKIAALDGETFFDEAAASPDGRRIFLVSRGAGIVVVLDGAGRRLSVLREFGRPTGARFNRFGEAWITDAGTGRVLRTSADGAVLLAVEGTLDPHPIAADPEDGGLWLTVRRYRAADGKTYSGIVRVSREGRLVEGAEAGADGEGEEDDPPGRARRVGKASGLWRIASADRGNVPPGLIHAVLAGDGPRVLVLPTALVVRDGPGSYRVLDRVVYPEPRAIWP